MVVLAPMRFRRVGEPRSRVELLLLGGARMTAEIAVLNRFAVALAADSAVTIGDGSDTKIFQSENKLFQLSEEQPIAIMLYNATVYYGIPWELIIKDFREKHRNLRVEKLFDVVPIFLQFLCDAYKPSDDQQQNFLLRTLINSFQPMYMKFAEKAFEMILKKRSNKTAGAVLQTYFNTIVDQEIRKFSAWDNVDQLSLSDATDIIDKYSDVLDQAIEIAFQRKLPLDDTEKMKVKELGARIIKSAEPRNTTTGLVFAGFGSKELFPSLSCVEVQGFIDGKLIKTDFEKVDIDRASSTASVIPFAQREAADSLLYGRADVYENSIVSHFSDVIKQVGDAIVEVSTNSTKKRRELKKKVEDAREAAIQRFTTTARDKRRYVSRGFGHY